MRSSLAVVPRWSIVMFTGLTFVALGMVWLLMLRTVDVGSVVRDSRTLALVVITCGTVLFTTGLAIAILGPALRRDPIALQQIGSHRVVLSTTLLVIVASNLPPTLFALATSTRNLNTLAGFLIAAASVEAVLILVTYARIIRPGVVTWHQLGFDRWRLADGLRRGVIYGVGAFIVSALVQLGMEKVGIHQTQLNEFAWLRSLELWQFAVAVLVGAVGAPIAEELFFRGYVFSAYLGHKGPLTAYVVSSALFASLHLNREAFVPILILGGMLCWMYRTSGSLIPPITAHALNNAAALTIFYFAPTLPNG